MSRARSESGFTIIEVLVTTALLGFVIAGAATVVEVIMRQGGGVLQRTESAQRGRLALDAMTRQIRSQVCLNETTKGLIAATPTSLTFYADFSDGSGGAATERRRLEYLPAERRVVETVWDPPGAATATRTTTLIEDVVPARDETQPSTPLLPFFRYWAYPNPLPASPQANQALTGTLTPAQVGRIARVGLSFSVRPAGASSDDFGTPLQDDVVLRNSDPNATTPDPTCR